MLVTTAPSPPLAVEHVQFQGYFPVVRPFSGPDKAQVLYCRGWKTLQQVQHSHQRIRGPPDRDQVPNRLVFLFTQRGYRLLLAKGRVV